MRRIQIDSADLMRQASMTAHDYLLNAIESVNRLMGKGYGEKHPELLAAMVQAAAIDMGTAVIAGAIEDLSETIEGLPTTLA